MTSRTRPAWMSRPIPLFHVTNGESITDAIDATTHHFHRPLYSDSAAANYIADELAAGRIPVIVNRGIPIAS